jgi:hypothetical protein
MSEHILLRILALTTCLICLAGCTAEKPNAATGSGPTAKAPAVEELNPQVAAMYKAAAEKPSELPEGDDWQSLFDGQSLKGWHETDFAGRGEVRIHSGLMVLNMGDPFTGVNLTNSTPTTNYEIALDAMRVNGSDFFCGLTFPVGTNSCSLIVGGWGGTLVGISSLDGMDASENETTKFRNFENGQWYRIRVRVTEKKLQAWIDKDRLIDVETEGKKITVRPGDIEMSQPFGICSWQTSAALREMKIRKLPGVAGK